jgi:hypothetical protein
MARLPRYFAKGVPQHIILRGNNREPIFANDEDCQFFKEALLDAAQRYQLIDKRIKGDATLFSCVSLLKCPDSPERYSPEYPTTSPNAAIGVKIFSSRMRIDSPI